MEPNKDRVKALLASSRNSEFGHKLVGRLLTAVEVDQTTGAGYGDDYSQNGGGFTQCGGSYNQDSGTYNMGCKSPTAASIA